MQTRVVRRENPENRSRQLLQMRSSEGEEDNMNLTKPWQIIFGAFFLLCLLAPSQPASAASGEDRTRPRCRSAGAAQFPTLALPF